MEDQEHSSGIFHAEDVGRECGANRTDKVELQCGEKRGKTPHLMFYKPR